MKNEKVIEHFITQQAGDEQSHTKNLYTIASNSTLVNYRTTLAKFDHAKKILYINTSKYSVTTSKIQTYIKRAANELDSSYTIEYVNHKDLNY